MANWMRAKWTLVLAALTGITTLSCVPQQGEQVEQAQSGEALAPAAHASARYAVVKSDEEWKRLLPAETFRVMRKHGTESPFNNAFDRNKADGIYYCASCGQKLYDAKHKYDSGTGWPSFYQPIDTKLIGTREDNTLFSVRTEVHCSRCGGHLGHVFDDGPKPTGLRYCMNSAAMSFRKRSEPAPPLLK